MDVEMTTAMPYEPPALVEVGGFSEDTLGWGHWFFDGYSEGDRG
ncbi:lasso RiPP family leader peptide-containing protein [Saccharothrix sp. Mg75]